MRKPRGFVIRIAAAVVGGLAVGAVSWVLLGPYQASSELFRVTLVDGTTLTLATNPGVSKASLTEPATPDQTAGPFWAQPVATIDGPSYQDPVTYSHPEREAVAVRNAGLASVGLLLILVPVGEYIRVRRSPR